MILIVVTLLPTIDASSLIAALLPRTLIFDFEASADKIIKHLQPPIDQAFGSDHLEFAVFEIRKHLVSYGQCSIAYGVERSEISTIIQGCFLAFYFLQTQDGEAYVYLLNVLAPEHCSPTTLDANDPEEMTILVLEHAEKMDCKINRSRIIKFKPCICCTNFPPKNLTNRQKTGCGPIPTLTGLEPK